MTLRKRLGYWKWVLIGGGWHQHAYGVQLRRSMRRALEGGRRLEPVTVRKGSEVEVHMLCGHDHVGMALWSWWSLLRYVDGEWSAFVHSDGSLTSEDSDLFRRLFPGLTVVAHSSTDDFLSGVGGRSAFPKLSALRDGHRLAKKVSDFHLVGQGKVVVMFDSDILFFQRPEELLRSVEECREDGVTMAAMEDLDSMYAASPDVLSRAYGVTVPARLNSGLVVMPRLGGVRIGLLEKVLEKSDPKWLSEYFMEQTVVAALAGHHRYQHLSRGYRVPIPGTASERREGDVCVHYVSNTATRPRFFDVGLARLMGR